MRRFFREHRLTIFFALAYLLSWYPWILALRRGETSGPNPLGPLVAGIIVTAVVYGRAGLREFFSRIVRWRVAWKWYAIVFSAPFVLCAVALALTLCTTDRTQVGSLTSDKFREIPEHFLFILLFIGLGEEPGWRGFALPELQTKHSALKASLILAPLWALWHLPLIGHEFQGPIIPAFFISVFGGTLMLTWLC